MVLVDGVELRGCKQLADRRDQTARANAGVTAHVDACRGESVQRGIDRKRKLAEALHQRVERVFRRDIGVPFLLVDDILGRAEEPVRLQLRGDHHEVIRRVHRLGLRGARIDSR